MSERSISRLEEARRRLDEGRPDLAASLARGRVAPPLRGEAALLLGEALRAQGYFRAAAVAYRGALSSLKRGDADLAVDAWLGLVRCARSLGEIGGARAALAAARRLARRPSADLAETFEMEEALVDRAEGRYPQAIRRLSTLLKTAVRRGDAAAQGYLLWALGGARRFSGDLAAAHRDFRAARAAFNKADDREGLVYALFGLGGIARVRGLFAEARAAYAKAGALLGTGPDIFGRAYAHCGLANVLRQQGLLALAESHYRRAHVLYAKLDDGVDLAYVDWGLGQVHLRRGELAPAERRLRAALRAFSKSDEARGAALSLHALAQVVHARGRTREGEALFDAAVRRSRRAGLHAHLEIFT